MGGNSLLADFCGAVQGRLKKFGFDWATLIITLLPVVIEMLSTCFSKPADLEAFARGKRGPLQMAGLRNKCRRIVQEQGVRGWFAVNRAANDLQECICAELSERANMASGPDLWQQVFDEAMSV